MKKKKTSKGKRSDRFATLGNMPHSHLLIPSQNYHVRYTNTCIITVTTIRSLIKVQNVALRSRMHDIINH